MKKGGWHLNNFMSIEDIGRKLASFSHVDLNVPIINNKKHIAESIRNGKDIISILRKDKQEGSTRHTDLEEIKTLPKGWEELHALVQKMQSVE
jgi:hypothetical protein